jgi:hypothetical protein
VTFVATVPQDPYYAFAKLEPQADRWRVVGWGGCRAAVDLSGLNAATWRLGRGQHIKPTSTSFFAYVTEMECASGHSSEDRLRPPIITYEPDRVVVVYSVEGYS